MKNYELYYVIDVVTRNLVFKGRYDRCEHYVERNKNPHEILEILDYETYMENYGF